MKKVSILFFLLLVLKVINAQDLTNDKKKINFPGNIWFEFTNEFQFDTIGIQPAVNYGWSDIYVKSSIYSGIEFPIKFYTIGIWIGDFVEFPLNYIAPNVEFNIKNNFLLGLDNTFSIENVFNIGVDFEFKLGSTLGSNPITGNNDGLEIVFSPILDLNGEYDFGLSWEICQSFEFYLYPNSGTLFHFADIEGTYFISYDFLHFFAPEMIKGGLYTELFFWQRINNENINTDNQLLNLDPAIGLFFDIYNVTPSLLFFVHIKGNSTRSEIEDVWLGIKGGISFKKDWFSLKVFYYGTISYQDNSEWQNHIEVCASISIE